MILVKYFCNDSSKKPGVVPASPTKNELYYAKALLNNIFKK